MLAKILSPSQIGLVNVLKIRFNMAISLKKIKEKMFEREKYYTGYEMASGALRVDHEKYKIYISTRSPEVVRTEESKYRILGHVSNFTLTFLQNLDHMGKQFSWSNRKNISVNFRDIIQMQSVTTKNPVTIKNEYYSVYNNQESRSRRQLKIQVMQDGQTLKLSLMIVTENDNEKWSGVFEMNWNDYNFLVQSAKKNIYYSSGMKSMIELQKRQIIRMMDKRVVNNEVKQLKSTIEYDIDQKDLLDQMGNSEDTKPAQTKPKCKKKVKQPQTK